MLHHHTDRWGLMEPDLKRGIKLMLIWKGINKKQEMCCVAKQQNYFTSIFSVQERDSSLDSLKSGLKIAQTQTEKKISFLQQFRYCFMGNDKYR